jgi:adenylate kinase
MILPTVRDASHTALSFPDLFCARARLDRDCHSVLEYFPLPDVSRRSVASEKDEILLVYMGGTNGAGKTMLASAFTMQREGWTSVNLNMQLRVSSKLLNSELEELSPEEGLPLVNKVMTDLLSAARSSSIIVDGHFLVASHGGHKPVLGGWAAEAAGYIVVQAPANQIRERLNRRSKDGFRSISTGTTAASIERSQQLEWAEAEAAAASFDKPLVNVENGDGQAMDALISIQNFVDSLKLPGNRSL